MKEKTGVSFGKFLRAAREKSGLGVNELAQLSGVSNAHISRLERDLRGAPSPNILAQLAKSLKISYEEMLQAAGYLKSDVVKEDYTGYGVHWVPVPVLGSIRGGEPADRLEYQLGYENVDSKLIGGHDAYILTVKGQSMAGDYIFDGDRVVVVAQPEVDPSDIAIVAVNGELATIKRIKRQGDTCVLVPSNPEFEPLIVPASEVYILGRVVEVRRRL